MLRSDANSFTGLGIRVWAHMTQTLLAAMLLSLIVPLPGGHVSGVA